MFDDIIGNDHIKNYLTKLINTKKIPNVFLFSGIDGIGKFLFAKTLAFYLMSDDFSKNDIFKKIMDENHPDLHIFRPVGKMSIHPIASIKELIHQASLAPFEAKSKVFIIDNVEFMQDEASNALLKILEEPFYDSYMILITSNLENILPTVISRTSLLKFYPIAEDEIKALLQKWGKTEKESLKIALLSQGSVSKACEIANFVDYDDKTQILLNILSKDAILYKDLKNEIDTLEKSFFSLSEDKVFKEIDLFLMYVFIWYRDIYILKNKLNKEFIFFQDRIEVMQTKENFPSTQEVEKLIAEVREGVRLNIKLKNCLERLFLGLNIV